MLCEIINNCV